MSDVFHELIVKGPFDRTEAFVAGFVAGKGVGSSKLWFSRECGIRQEKLPERIVEWAGIVKDRVHLIVEASLHQGIRAAIRKRGPDVGLEVLGSLRIVKAAFPFRYRCYNREIGAKIRNRFRRLPAGVSLAPGYSPKEKVRPNAAGIEMYSPRHEYELSGRGSVEGAVDKVIRFREMLAEFDLVEVSLIRLEMKS